MTYPLPVLAPVLAIAIFALTSSNAFAQGVTLQVGTFSMPASESCGGHSWCTTNAKGAMERNGLKVTTSGPDVTFGSGADVVTVVSCVEQGDHSIATIVAGSSDSSLAEKTRNSVRSNMVAGKCL